MSGKNEGFSVDLVNGDILHQILPMDTLHVMGSKGIASLFRFCFTELGYMSVVNQRLRLMPPVRNAGDGTRGLHYRNAGVGSGEGERKHERERE